MTECVFANDYIVGKEVIKMFGNRNGFDEADERSEDSSILSCEDRRLYFLYGDVTTKNCASIAYDITRINLEDDEKDKKLKDYERKPIHIYINSYGGSVYAMWMMVDSIEASTTPVYTYCNGYCMSAAFQIFLAGHKRFVSKHSTLMYHQIYCWRSGKYQDLVDDREHTDLLNDQIEKYVIDRTKLTAEDLQQIREKKKDTYFTANEAVERGIADAVLGVEAMDKNRKQKK